MEEHIAVQGVGPCFGASLRIDGLGDVAELVEQVEAVEHQEELAVEEGARETGVPAPFRVVHRSVSVASAAVKRQVGGELHLPRQGEKGGEGALDVGRAEVLEVLASAVEPLPCGCNGEFHIVLPVKFVGQVHFLYPPRGVDGAAL